MSQQKYIEIRKELPVEGKKKGIPSGEPHVFVPVISETYGYIVTKEFFPFGIVGMTSQQRRRQRVRWCKHRKIRVGGTTSPCMFTFDYKIQEVHEELPDWASDPARAVIL